MLVMALSFSILTSRAQFFRNNFLLENPAYLHYKWHIDQLDDSRQMLVMALSFLHFYEPRELSWDNFFLSALIWVVLEIGSLVKGNWN